MPEPQKSRFFAARILALLAIAIAAALYFEWPGGEDPANIEAEPSPPPMRVMRFVDPASVRHSPRFRFTYDPPAALAAYREEEGLDAIVEGADSDLDLFLRLLYWARDQFKPGRPDPYPPFDAQVILRDIRRGFTQGFCAQYNVVLAQALQSFGYPTRYVSVGDHEVIEGWLRDEKQWIVLDPYFRTLYLDEQGRALSALEVFERRREGKPFLLSPRASPSAAKFEKGTFTRLKFWLKGDFKSNPVNFEDRRVYFLDYVPGGASAPSDAQLVTSIPEDLYFDPDEVR